MMLRFSFVALAATLGAALGCGGSIDVEADTTVADGGAGDADAHVHADAHQDAKPLDAPADAPKKDAFDEYHDPGCPDAPIDPPQLECDALAPPPGGCPPDEACFPYVQYPSSPCGQEQYGTVCAPAGTGVQGTPCGGVQDCAGGFVCVISGSGVQCVKLCKLDQPGSCDDGLVCQPIDIPGFGGCL